MGFFKDFFKEIVDDATGGAISSMELNQSLQQLERLQTDINRFNEWFAAHSNDYTALLDSLNNSSYVVDNTIFHSNWLTGKTETAYCLTDDEINEKKRREGLIEDALQKLRPGQMKKLFKSYLSEVEASILDSYSVFRTFQNEMSYLPDFQKEIVDSVYLNELKKLLDASNQKTSLTQISDFVWQISKHKTHAGHAIVLLVLAKQVYYKINGDTREIMAQIENALVKAEDTIIDNTYQAYLPAEASDQNVEALLQTGKDLFLNGEPEKAFAYFLFAAKGGNAEAQYRTGLCFERGYGVYKNAEKAAYWYQVSSKSGDPVSKYYLAALYARVFPEEKRDYEKALALYHEAYNEGVADAADAIGVMYAEGTGIDKNGATAIQWYEQGAAAGSPSAMYHLYLAYINGDCVEANSETAGQWLKKCVLFFGKPEYSYMASSEDFFTLEESEDIIGGDVLLPGCDNLYGVIGCLYYNGNSVVPKDEYKAIAWFDKGAAIGDSYSLDWLSVIHCKKVNYPRSFQYAQRGADMGYSPCMNKLGLRYWNGEGTKKDLVVGNIWFLRAAKAGDVWGQRNIAFEFLSGVTGLPKDVSQARRWLSLAAEQGNEECQAKLIEFEEQQKEQQIKRLENDRNSILSQIAKVEEKINGAQSQREEERYLKEKDKLEEKLNAISQEISQYK